METLRPESFELLKLISEGLVIEKSSSAKHSCVDQLEKNGLIESHICSYYLDGSSPIPVYSNYVITEKGKGFLFHLQSEEQSFLALKSIAESAKNQAESASDQVLVMKEQLLFAQEQSISAKKESLESKRISIIAILVSMSAVVVAILQLFH